MLIVAGAMYCVGHKESKCIYDGAMTDTIAPTNGEKGYYTNQHPISYLYHL